MACHHSSRELVEDAWDEKMVVREEPPAQKRMKITVARMQQPLTDPGPLDILFTMALVLRSRIHGVHDAVKETATKQVAETVDKEEDSDEEESDKEEESDEEEESEEEEEEDANGIAYA